MITTGKTGILQGKVQAKGFEQQQQQQQVAVRSKEDKIHSNSSKLNILAFGLFSTWSRNRLWCYNKE
jgi:hypothetical protein